MFSAEKNPSPSPSASSSSRPGSGQYASEFCDTHAPSRFVNLDSLYEETVNRKSTTQPESDEFKEIIQQIKQNEQNGLLQEEQASVNEAKPFYMEAHRLLYNLVVKIAEIVVKTAQRQLADYKKRKNKDDTLKFTILEAEKRALYQENYDARLRGPKALKFHYTILEELLDLLTKKEQSQNRLSYIIKKPIQIHAFERLHWAVTYLIFTQKNNLVQIIEPMDLLIFQEFLVDYCCSDKSEDINSSTKDLKASCARSLFLALDYINPPGKDGKTLLDMPGLAEQSLLSNDIQEIFNCLSLIGAKNKSDIYQNSSIVQSFRGRFVCEEKSDESNKCVKYLFITVHRLYKDELNNYVKDKDGNYTIELIRLDVFSELDKFSVPMQIKKDIVAAMILFAIPALVQVHRDILRKLDKPDMPDNNRFGLYARARAKFVFDYLNQWDPAGYQTDLDQKLAALENSGEKARQKKTIQVKEAYARTSIEIIMPFLHLPGALDYLVNLFNSPDISANTGSKLSQLFNMAESIMPQRFSELLMGAEKIDTGHLKWHLICANRAIVWLFNNVDFFKNYKFIQIEPRLNSRLYPQTIEFLSYLLAMDDTTALIAFINNIKRDESKKILKPYLNATIDKALLYPNAESQWPDNNKPKILEGFKLIITSWGLLEANELVNSNVLDAAIFILFNGIDRAAVVQSGFSIALNKLLSDERFADDVSELVTNYAQYIKLEQSASNSQFAPLLQVIGEKISYIHEARKITYGNINEDPSFFNLDTGKYKDLSSAIFMIAYRIHYYTQKLKNDPKKLQHIQKQRFLQAILSLLPSLYGSATIENSDEIPYICQVLLYGYIIPKEEEKLSSRASRTVNSFLFNVPASLENVSFEAFQARARALLPNNVEASQIVNSLLSDVLVGEKCITTFSALPDNVLNKLFLGSGCDLSQIRINLGKISELKSAVKPTKRSSFRFLSMYGSPSNNHHTTETVVPQNKFEGNNLRDGKIHHDIEMHEISAITKTSTN